MPASPQPVSGKQLFMTELDFALINYELNRAARHTRRTRRSRRVRLWVISNVLGTLLGLGLMWLVTK